MLKDLIDNVKNNIEVRQNLIKIREELKESSNCYAMRYELEDDREFFGKLLASEDAKVRKNAALIIGKLGYDDYIAMLYKTYENEQQLFVKSAYLSAIGELDYRGILDKLKVRLEDLKLVETDENNQKHIMEERKTLSELVIAAEGIEKHKFTGYKKKNSIILLTNRNYPQITLEQVMVGWDSNTENIAKIFNAGVMVTTDNLNDVLSIRTYKELLFILDDVQSCDNDPIVAAKAISESSLMKFLAARHSGPDEYYFRVEYKVKTDLAKKSAFTKKFAGQLELLNKGKLLNSTSNYEVEIRLIENKEKRLNVLIKLYTINDTRFNYRVNTVAASIQPVNAALFMQLAKDYMKEDAKILDPFCGVGTMLIERHKFLKANTIYGIDIYGDAIDKARENTEKANVIAHYTNKDFFEFEHDYLFDEIITNMPRVTGHKLEEEIADIFKRFFEKIPKHMNENAVIIMHSYEPELVKKYCNSEYVILKQYEISKKENSYLFVIKQK